MSEISNNTSAAEPLPEADKAGDSRLWRALTMVAVAMIGAFLAYMTGTYELQSVRLEREIVQQNLITVTERQRLLDYLEASQQLTRRADAYRAIAESNAAAATDHVRTSEQAEILTLQAQEEFAAARALKPFIDATSRVVSSDGPDTDTNVRRSVDQFKEARGIASEPDSLAKLDEAMEKAHEKVRTLAGTVVVFILALVMFTLSDVYRATPYRSRTWFAIGVVIAMLGTAFAAFTNPELYIWLTGFVVVMVALFAAAWVLSGRHARRTASLPAANQLESDATQAHAGRHRDEHPHPEIKPEARSIFGLLGHAHTPYSRLIIYTMALTVFLSALSGFAYTWALIESSTASHQALKRQIELNTSMSADAEAIDTLLQVADAAEARARSQVVRYKAAYLSSRQRNDEALAATAQADALDASARNPVAAQWLEHPTLGADADAGFPRKLLNQRSIQEGKANRWESLAMWDAHNHESVRRNHIATVLLQTLTMLAVALYLLGHANAMGKSAGGWSLFTGGCVLLATAFVLALHAEASTMQTQIATVSDNCKSDPSHSSANMPAELRAARYYASARALLTTADSSEKYREALIALECMSQLRRGESTLPRVDYVRALELESTFQTNQPWAGLPLKEDLEGMIARMESVVREYRVTGEKPPVRILASLGRYRLLQALQRGDDKGAGDSNGRGKSKGGADGKAARDDSLKRSVELLTEAAEAVNAASDGREAQQRRILINLAIAQYASGLNRGADATANAALAIPVTGSKRFIGRALTDLELLRKHCVRFRTPDECASLAKRIDSLKGSLVATTWQQSTMFPVALARSDDAGAPVKEMTVDVTPDGLRWSLPPLRISSQQQLALVWYEYDARWEVWRAMPDVSGLVAVGRDSVISYPAATRLERCIAADPGARYRAELYLDGKLVATGIGAPASEQRFKPWLLSDLNVAFCAPVGWTEIDVPLRSDSDSMLVRAIGTSNGTSAMVFFTFYGFNRSDASPQQIARVADYLVRGGWLDAQTTLVPREPSASCAKSDPFPAYVTRTTNERVRHIAVALHGDASADACIALRSLTNRYGTESPGGAKPPPKATLAAR